MNKYNFLVAHGYTIMKGFVTAESEEEAIKMIYGGEWDDVIDEYDTDILTEGFEVLELNVR